MKNFSKARGIILAAGRGSRMHALTADRPKCLVRFQDRTLLDWQVGALRAGGIDEIAVVTGYRRDMVAREDLAEFHNARWAETNMVASLECASTWLESGPCLISYSDIFYESEGVRLLLHSENPIAILYDPRWRVLWERRFGDPLSDAETFSLRGDGSVADIGGKPDSVDDIEGQYMGLLRFEPSGWSEVQRIRQTLGAVERDRIDMTGTLRQVIAGGRVAIGALPYQGTWGEIDSPGDLALYEDGNWRGVSER